MVVAVGWGGGGVLQLSLGLLTWSYRLVAVSAMYLYAGIIIFKHAVNLQVDNSFPFIDSVNLMQGVTGRWYDGVRRCPRGGRGGGDTSDFRQPGHVLTLRFNCILDEMWHEHSCTGHTVCEAPVTDWPVDVS